MSVSKVLSAYIITDYQIKKVKEKLQRKVCFSHAQGKYDLHIFFP